MSFVFFDTETTGLKAGFDQILQFAAVRTDANLNEVDRFEMRCRMLPHVLPHPSALKVNRLPMERLADVNLPTHYAMVSHIQRTLLSWSPAVFVGFNSIRFDEEMLRHALFQCLYPAYLTSNNKNCRADALSLLMAASTASPTQLSVPLGAEDRPTFRLHAVAEANGIAQVQAHDALSDALITLGLCRLIRDRAPELWQGFVRFSNKATVADFVDSEEGFVLTEFFGGQAFHKPVVCLGLDPDQNNGRLCLRLDGDFEALLRMSEMELRAHLSIKPSPVRRFRINAAPTLTALHDAAVHMLGGSLVDEIEDRARRLKSDASLIGRLTSAYVASRQTYPPSPHLEERIYNGFPGRADEARMEAFHKVPWSERITIAQSFEDERLRWFGLRLIYIEARVVLPKTVRDEVESLIAGQLLGDGTGALTYEQALNETDNLLKDAPDSSDMLSKYRAYLLHRRSRAMAYQGGLHA
jgi:exodeoxyribonuclease I